MTQKKITISTPVLKLETDLEKILWPKIESYNSGFIKVSDLHSLWFAEYGNPNGMPVIVVHGGPGAGCDLGVSRLFNPQDYRVILVDQRGSEHSTPLGEIKENTTQHLVDDLESVREYLKIEKWVIFGGSWGVALSIAYGIKYTERCLGFILRGIYLGEQEESLRVWLSLGDFFPEYFDEFVRNLPVENQQTIVKSYCEKMLSEDHKESLAAASAWGKYNMAAAYLLGNKEEVDKIMDEQDSLIACARIYAHYSMNDYFFEEKELINNISKVISLPSILVHGRYDIICLPKVAYKLHKAWPGSELILVPDAGHSGMEAGIAMVLKDAAIRMKCVVKGN